MFEKKVKEEEKKVTDKKGKEKKKSNVGFILKTLLIPAVVAAIAVCLIYLFMMNKSKNEIVKAPVVCAVVDIDANTYVKADEVDKYFAVVDVEAAILPSNIYSDFKALPADGFYVETDMSKNQMLVKEDVAKTDDVMDKYGKGTQYTSIKANAFDNSVSGSIRHGDIVDVYAKDPATDQLVLMVSNVYVEAAYDNSGNELTREYEAQNGEQRAGVFTVKVAPDEIEQMNLAICYEGIQLYLTNE